MYSVPVLREVCDNHLFINLPHALPRRRAYKSHSCRNLQMTPMLLGKYFRMCLCGINPTAALERSSVQFTTLASSFAPSAHNSYAAPQADMCCMHACRTSASHPMSSVPSAYHISLNVINLKHKSNRQQTAPHSKTPPPPMSCSSLHARSGQRPICNQTPRQGTIAKKQHCTAGSMLCLRPRLQQKYSSPHKLIISSCALRPSTHPNPTQRAVHNSN